MLVLDGPQSFSTFLLVQIMFFDCEIKKKKTGDLFVCKTSKVENALVKWAVMQKAVKFEIKV